MVLESVGLCLHARSVVRVTVGKYSCACRSLCFLIYITWIISCLREGWCGVSMKAYVYRVLHSAWHRIQQMLVTVATALAGPGRGHKGPGTALGSEGRQSS